ncbi:Uncharacterised protein [BD1-7 clade bacterium]|uniref:RDD domain-containing protein n=1 Tax=BD1-7 clade bacterium TaxID=2029982 RepID=A0A5S9PR48_9GAMM|nr:Uncharacterised protein [BD1-7 clade bacterium]
MTDDIYKTPDATLDASVVDSNPTYELASRWKRLFASLVDTLVLVVVIVPIMYFVGFFDDIMEGIEPTLTMEAAMSVVAIVLYFAIHGYWMKTEGKTLGKKLFGIRVVTVSGEFPSLGKHQLRRYVSYLMFGQLPGFLGLLSLVDALMIFRRDKRCLHDIVGDTIVVNDP